MNTARVWRKLLGVDPLLAASTFGLLALGMVMTYSASSILGAERFRDSAHFLRHHLFAVAVGLGCMTAMFGVNLRFLRRLALPSLAVVGVLLLLTAFTPLGLEANHARRWLRIFGFVFQPSEIAKPVFVLYVASYVARRGEALRQFRAGLLPLLLTVGALLLPILAQPDFGTAVVVAATVFAMLFAARVRLLHLGSLAAAAVAGITFLIESAPYRRRRFLAFLNPWEDSQGSGFQIIQSLIAFQRGGFRGEGLGDGTQKLLYLPEAHTDFIFAVIAEELGLWGSLVTVVLFAVLTVQGLRLSVRIGDVFISQLVLGLTSLIGLQALLNMAVVMGLVPTKGITLPFVSFGGTSLVMTMACAGVLLSLSSLVPLGKTMARRVAA